MVVSIPASVRNSLSLGPGSRRVSRFVTVGSSNAFRPDFRYIFMEIHFRPELAFLAHSTYFVIWIVAAPDHDCKVRISAIGGRWLDKNVLSQFYRERPVNYITRLRLQRIAARVLNNYHPKPPAQCMS